MAATETDVGTFKNFINGEWVEPSGGTDTVFKRATAGWYYGLMRRIVGKKVPSGAGDFRLLSRDLVDALRSAHAEDVLAHLGILRGLRGSVSQCFSNAWSVSVAWSKCKAQRLARAKISSGVAPAALRLEQILPRLVWAVRVVGSPNISESASQISFLCRGAAAGSCSSGGSTDG